MVDIFFTSFKEPLDDTVYSEFLSLLPEDLRKRNARFMRWQDRHANLFGKLLLIEALKHHNINTNIWNLITYGKHKRPYLTLPTYDFNISHSGDYVICAISKNIQLGVDIEENRARRFNHFDNVMTKKQWKDIQSSNNPIRTFYKYWTIKESVIKADGRGFYIPLDQLEIRDNTVQFEDRLWFLNNLDFAEGYSAAIATSKLTTFKTHELNFYE
ncbi:4'-phosphopantetheinyl transferase family protein [Kordia zhangzhouensis]|uniref:4'-phosphopantetheinyl transferase family protein n=1 Tax=Kordia zhangzhouensis TaxID=1620405 RepID=UPI00062997A8|nr:4'-phosphopantetheinyl transferase superfamily protein [Kordia zhangzhouensis]